MNENPTENPFEQSTLENSSSLMSIPTGLSTQAGDVEARYPPAVRVVTPFATAFGGVISAIVLFIALQPPLNIALAAFIAITDFAMAGVLWWWFSNAFVRADDIGVTQAKFGKTQTVRWEDITSFGAPAGGATTQIALRDADGKTLMTFNRSMNENGNMARLLELIAARTQSQETPLTSRKIRNSIEIG